MFPIRNLYDCCKSISSIYFSIISQFITSGKFLLNRQVLLSFPELLFPTELEKWNDKNHKVGFLMIGRGIELKYRYSFKFSW